MIARISLLLWLLIVWLALRGSVSVGSVLLGSMICVALLVFFRIKKPEPGTGVIRPLYAFLFGAWFVRKLVEANLEVAYTVLRPEVRKLGIVAIPLVPATTTIMALLAWTISLTPGTFIVDTRSGPEVFYVHVLRMESPEQLRLDILDMQRRIVQAFGTKETLASIESLIAELRISKGQEP